MRTKEQVEDKVVTYMNDMDYIFSPKGYIVWRRSTGDNYEILFIEVKKKGKGTATELVRMMLQRIKPFHSVFVFRLKGNETAGHFYRHLGFKETEIKGLYKGDDAVLGVANYKVLKKLLG